MINTGVLTEAMDIFLLGHSMKGSSTTILSEPMKKWLLEHHVERCLIFTTTNVDSAPLVHEIKSVSTSESLQVETHPLHMIDTTNANSPEDLNRLPWMNLNEIIKQIDLVNETVVFCGRSSSMFDHLLWLGAQCFRNVSVLNIDTTEPALDLCLDNIGGEISPQAISGLLTLHIDDIKSGRTDTENIGFSDAERLGNIPGAGLVKGVNNALGPYVSRNMVGKTDVAEDSVTYNLLPHGLGAACRTWMENRTILETHLKSLNIVFGRLPSVQSARKGGKYRSFDEFFNFMSPLQPVDGYIAVVQRHDSTIEGHHVLTLNEALERFVDTDIIGDLRHCKMVLHRRQEEDAIEALDHLIVINPVASPDFHMKFVLKLLTACVSFEEEYGMRIWEIDITQVMIELRSALSFLSFVCNLSTTYIVKNVGQGGGASGLRRRDLALQVPNTMAFQAFSQLSEGHGNNKGAANLLISLFLCEQMMVEPSDEFDIDPFDEPPEAQSNQTPGLTQKEIQNFIEGLATELNLNEGLSNINRTIRQYLLVEQGLIRKFDPPQKGKTTYSLTHLGRFVAVQLERIRKEGAGN